MGADDGDPLNLFDDGPTQACIGEWKNEHLQVKIFLRSGRLVLESGKNELVLTDVSHNVWSVADNRAPETEVYVAKITGYGFQTRLTLQPPSHKGSSKKAVLQRVEHAGMQEADPPNEARLTASSERGRGGRRDEGRERRSPPGRGDDWDRPRRGGSRNRSSGRWSPDGRSRSPPYRGKSPRHRGGESNGSEEIITLFLTGLPNDAREDAVRADLDKSGGVQRVVMMRRGVERNAFVRFENVPDMQRCMDDILDGRTKVCGQKVKAEVARRNTN